MGCNESCVHFCNEAKEESILQARIDRAVDLLTVDVAGDGRSGCLQCLAPLDQCSTNIGCRTCLAIAALRGEDQGE